MQFNTTLKAKNLGTRKGTIEFIVLHDTAGSGTANDARYLANDPEHRKISVDFCVTKDGTIYQLNPDLRGHVTFHAGRRTKFRGRTNGNVNQHSIGIEIAQQANMSNLGPEPYPFAQVSAVAALCNHLCKGFDLTKADITTHAHIITDGSRSDPRKFPWDDFWTLFNSEDPSAHTPVYHTVVAGDTLYSLAQTYETTVEHIKALNSMNDPSNVINVGQNLKVKE